VQTDLGPRTAGALQRLSDLVATGFGTGLLPRAPGTWASLAALPIAWILQWWAGGAALALAAIVMFGFGLWSVSRFLPRADERDPGVVVVDEVVGQWIALVPAGLDPALFFLGFVSFRIFDIAKPWPIRVAERRLSGAWGVMLDDVLAAFYAAAIVFVAARYGVFWA
jgi:phosphatidylglycerophosphatase A